MLIAVHSKCKLLSYRLTSNSKLHTKSRNLLLLLTKGVLRGACIICDRCCHNVFYKASMWQNLMEHHDGCSTKHSFLWNPFVTTAYSKRLLSFGEKKINALCRGKIILHLKSNNMKKGSFNKIMFDSLNWNSSVCPEMIVCVSRYLKT